MSVKAKGNCEELKEEYLPGVKSNFQVLLSGMPLGRYVDAPPPSDFDRRSHSQREWRAYKRTSGRRILSKSAGHLHWMELVQSVGHFSPSLLVARIN